MQDDGSAAMQLPMDQEQVPIATRQNRLGQSDARTTMEYTVSRGWQHYLEKIQTKIEASQGLKLHDTLGGIPLKNYPFRPIMLLNGYWDYDKDFTNYILDNVCQSTTCN
jgi:hypothetical protein